jgi:hypothetical protein
VGILAGPFVAAAALLALGGWFKVRRPEPTARALRNAGLGVFAPLARVLGAAELAVGLGALAFDTRVLPGLVAGSYLAFAAFVASSLARETPAPDCGCFGQTESPPTVVHLALNLGAVAVAAAVALGSGGGLAAALRDQPLGGAPFLLLAATCVGLAYAALAVLPRSLDRTRS